MKYKLLKFSASWCGPCRVLEQKLKDFKKCDIIKCDIDNTDEEMLAEFKIRNVPTTIIVDENNKEVGRFIGIFNVADLEAKLNELEQNG